MNTSEYWAGRLAASPGLQGTGTSDLPLAWQRWLYRAKRRGVLALLDEHHVDVHGRAVFDFGCGTGYFEDLWEARGAASVAGLDVVPHVVDELRAAHPGRTYVTGDVSRDDTLLEAVGTADLTTAIDVLYHVVDDADAATVVRRLLAPTVTRTWFLFTDALTDHRPADHVRFRTLDHWADLLADHGFAPVGRRPLYVLHNRPSRLAARAPGPVGAARYLADRLALPLVGARRANMFAVLARRR